MKLNPSSESLPFSLHFIGDPNETEREIPATAGSQMNMHAVFLHVLGDALGSLVVIASALFIYFVKVSSNERKLVVIFTPSFDNQNHRETNFVGRLAVLCRSLDEFGDFRNNIMDNYSVVT